MKSIFKKGLALFILTLFILHAGTTLFASGSRESYNDQFLIIET